MRSTYCSSSGHLVAPSGKVASHSRSASRSHALSPSAPSRDGGRGTSRGESRDSRLSGSADDSLEEWCFCLFDLILGACCFWLSVSSSSVSSPSSSSSPSLADSEPPHCRAKDGKDGEEGEDEVVVLVVKELSSTSGLRGTVTAVAGRLVVVTLPGTEAAMAAVLWLPAASRP